MKRIANDIQTGTFQRVYLIFGNEPYLVREVTSKLFRALSGDDTMNTMVIADRMPTLEEVRNFTETMPFFADRRVLLIEDSGLFSTGGESPFPKWIETLPETAAVVFSEASVDKRFQLYKTVQKTGTAVELNRLEGAERSDWLLREIGKRKVKITKNAFLLLLDTLPESMEASVQELDKLASYVGENGAIDERSVEEIVTPKVENRIFKIVEATVSGDRKTAFRLYYDLTALKEPPPIVVISLIGKELMKLRTVALMRERRKSNAEIASVLGVPEFVVRKLAAAAGRASVEKLSSDADKALELDYAVKSGDLTDSVAAELLLFHLT